MALFYETQTQDVVHFYDSGDTNTTNIVYHQLFLDFIPNEPERVSGDDDYFEDDRYLGVDKFDEEDYRC